MFVELTDEAVTKLLEKTSKADNRNIRIGVKGSGCNGFKYEFDFLKGKPNLDNDLEVDYGKFSIWTSKQSVEYLHGMQLDYQYQGINEGFTFINPKATAYCGCGESFSI
jgi:iron-sulfur cluster assembly accessory protein